MKHDKPSAEDVVTTCEPACPPGASVLSLLCRLGGVVRNFFVLCGGASPAVIGHGHPYETFKYVVLGQIVLVTAFFAGLSGGYATYTFSGSAPVAAAVGILWGITILTIDRGMILTVKKHESFPRQFGNALPRLLMAVLIGVAISTPLELRIFDDEIRQGIVEQKFEKAIHDVTTEADKLTEKKEERERTLSNQTNSIDPVSTTREVDPNSASRKRPNMRTITTDPGKKVAIVQTQLDDIRAEAAALRRQIRALEEHRRCLVTSRNAKRVEEPGAASPPQDGGQNRSQRPAAAPNPASQLENQEEASLIQKQQALCRDTASAILFPKQDYGFLDRLTALDALAGPGLFERAAIGLGLRSRSEAKGVAPAGAAAGEPGDADSFRRSQLDRQDAVFNVSLLVMSLFILLESSPIVAKLMLPEGVYDKKLQLLREHIRLDEITAAEKFVAWYNDQLTARGRAETERYNYVGSLDQVSRKLIFNYSDGHIKVADPKREEFFDIVRLNGSVPNAPTAIRELIKRVETLAARQGESSEVALAIDDALRKIQVLLTPPIHSKEVMSGTIGLLKELSDTLEQRSAPANGTAPPHRPS